MSAGESAVWTAEGGALELAGYAVCLGQPGCSNPNDEKAQPHEGGWAWVSP